MKQISFFGSPVLGFARGCRLRRLLMVLSAPLLVTVACGASKISVEQPSGVPVPGRVTGWGGAYGGALAPPVPLAPVSSLKLGSGWSMAIMGDGSVVPWGDNQQGQLSGIAGQSGFISIDAGSSHGVAVRPNGT
ncbi:MAG TPA: hypothetical protein VHM91_08360, partial [Verrucomicrobiales bacterium]|nr:hypothetical protein [Verrucomicrobiales bacterium]